MDRDDDVSIKKINVYEKIKEVYKDCEDVSDDEWIEMFSSPKILNKPKSKPIARFLIKIQALVNKIKKN